MKIIKSQLVNVGDEMQAVDIRDEKMYWVAKLADGDIWMTQNLDLDLKKDGSIVYDSTNTNLPANTTWTPDNSTLAVEDTSVSGWGNRNTVPDSAGPGDVYYYTSGTSDNDTQYNSLADCEAAGHTDCAHYHAGNYYNWSAAVASNNTSGITSRYRNAPSSICPAGRRLPTGRDSGNTAASREWNALLVAEGIMISPSGSGYATNGFSNIRIAPLWLARSGGVYNGSLSDTGLSGYYWSSSVYDSSIAYRLYFNSGSVNPALSNSRDVGYPVRCIAQ